VPDVKMNYGSMEKMAKEFKGASKAVDEAQNAVTKLFLKCTEGALVGQGGDAYTDALMSKLLPRLIFLGLKMEELEQDIKGAVSATRDGVKTAQSRFK